MGLVIFVGFNVIFGEPVECFSLYFQIVAFGTFNKVDSCGLPFIDFDESQT